jgi:hypothetical protein
VEFITQNGQAKPIKSQVQQLCSPQILPQLQTHHIWDVNHLRYDVSMEWLYPVILKINETVLDNYGEMGVYITPYSCMIADDIYHPVVSHELTENTTLHEIIWETVYDFIQFYNKIKTKDEPI